MCAQVSALSFASRAFYDYQPARILHIFRLRWVSIFLGLGLPRVFRWFDGFTVWLDRPSGMGWVGGVCRTIWNLLVGRARLVACTSGLSPNRRECEGSARFGQPFGTLPCSKICRSYREVFDLHISAANYRSIHRFWKALL
jgi:hypothetical protein